MAISNIKDIYLKDISQKVKWVIMAEQIDDETIYTELDEFVITQELQKHIQKFFESYNDVSDNSKDTVWVWISGFFGSGKSHLLKILSYLIENRKIKDKTPLEFFTEKLKDEQLLLGDITRAISNKDIDVMLFNIDSRAGKNSKNQKDGILEVFVKVFNEKLGYCSDIPWLADFEHTLYMKWDYEKFKEKFKEVSHEEWNNIKDNFYFERENIIKALIDWDIMSINDANTWFEADGKDYNMSVSKFAGIIKKYSEKKWKDHKIVFLVDEIGQYIGDNTNLMLNLQTLVEDLWKELKWKAWIIVTSQEAIDKITEIKWKDFSKIQWRFPTKLMLSSQNTDEVIKKRLLEKTKDAQEYLQAYYTKNETIIKNLFSFSANTADMKLFKNKEDFAATYPFIPYQFNLLQKVFEKIRVIGVAGSHIADWNRSMLNGYQEAWSAILDKEIWTIVPFSAFYSTIETFISGEIKRTIYNASENSVLKPIDIEVLKVLFLIRYIDEVPCDVENITTLLISNIDEDKQDLRNNIKLSLDRLISQTLIHKNGDEYLFLTNEEQDINKQINAEEVDKLEILKYIGDVIFNEFYKSKKYQYSSSNNYNFNQLIDEFWYENSRQYGLVLKITTPLSTEVWDTLFYAKEYSLGEIKLEKDNELITNLLNLKKIEKWLRKNSTNDFSKDIRTIINDKSKEIDDIKARIRKLLEDGIKNWTIYINGKEVEDIKTNISVINIFNEILGRLVVIAYKNVDWMNKHYTTDEEIVKILKINNIEQQTLLNTEDNKNAVDEIKNFISMQSSRSLKTSFKTIVDKYSVIPYGWNEYDIAGAIAQLYVTWELQFKYNDEVLQRSNPDIVEYLTKTREFEKLVISTKRQIDKGILLQVKTIIQWCFDITNLPENEDDLHERIKSIFEQEIEKLDSFNKKHHLPKYPVRYIFDLTRETIYKFIRIPDNNTFFEYIISQKEELEKYESDFRTISNFFDSQVKIFDEAMEKVAFYEEEFKLFLPEERSKIAFDTFDEIKGILSSSSPYSQIKDLPLLINAVKTGYNEIAQEKKKVLEEKLLDLMKKLEEEIDRNQLTELFKEKILSRFLAIKDAISNTDSCTKLWALRSSLNETYSSANVQITNEVNRMIEEIHVLSNSKLPSEKPKKQVSIDINNIIKKWITIKSLEEVDLYTSELNRMLKERLQSWDDLRII
jgi:hypothetical protein